MARPARTSDLMWPKLFKRFEGISPTLQGQLRDMVVQGVLDGFFQPEQALPSSRLLAQSLGLSRTTVSLALQALTDQGFLTAKPRSGYIVSSGALTSVARQTSVPHTAKGEGVSPPQAPDLWQHRLHLKPSTQHNIEKPLDWQQQPYPFVYGQFDATLFPFRNWRRCVLETIEARSVRAWAPDHIDRDDAQLVEQIHSRLLPARGIWVERDQILVTSGAQQGLFLLAQLLMGPTTHVGVEVPGYPDARNNFALRTPHLYNLDVDDQGLVPNHKLRPCDYVFVTPSHQCPTTVTLSMQRRLALLEQAHAHDFIVIEDDHESELNFSTRPMPALKSLDTEQRVVYVGSLSKTLAHGLRLGFIVASKELVTELRALRRLTMRHIPSNNQQAAASFIAHGFHEAHMRKLIQTYKDRSSALKQALTTHAPQLQFRDAKGGSALWVTGPKHLNTKQLAIDLYAQGIVVEPGAFFYPTSHKACNSMRVGYSSIAVEKIVPGIQALTGVMALHPNS